MADPSTTTAAPAAGVPPSPATPAEAKDRLTATLEATLEEYKALRAEVLQRSAAQNHIAEFHVTILTAIVGAAILHQDLTPWLLLLIPVESALFGSWYIDHALFVARLGSHIHDKIEKAANRLCGETVLSWEAELRKDAARSAGWRSLLAQLGFLPFVLPCVVALVLSLCLLCAPAMGKELGVPTPFYQSPLKGWVAWLGWLSGLGYFAMYVGWVVRYRPLWSQGNGARGDNASAAS